MSLKPLNDRVLVKRLESEEKTAGGLYITEIGRASWRVTVCLYLLNSVVAV